LWRRIDMHVRGGEDGERKERGYSKLGRLSLGNPGPCRAGAIEIVEDQIAVVIDVEWPGDAVEIAIAPGPAPIGTPRIARARTSLSSQSRRTPRTTRAKPRRTRTLPSRAPGRTPRIARLPARPTTTGPAYPPFGPRSCSVTLRAGGRTRNRPVRVRTSLALPPGASAITVYFAFVSLPLIGSRAALAGELATRSASKHAPMRARDRISRPHGDATPACLDAPARRGVLERVGVWSGSQAVSSPRSSKQAWDEPEVSARTDGTRSLYDSGYGR